MFTVMSALCVVAALNKARCACFFGRTVDPGSSSKTALWKSRDRYPLVVGFLILILESFSTSVSAVEMVRFESARYRLGFLSAQRSTNNGLPNPPGAQTILEGYLFKPEGAGPFPAVALLHGCAGLPQGLKSREANSPWTSRFTGWGYVVLAVDSFTTRGVQQTCTGTIEPYRVADAQGALNFLSNQYFVDPERILVLGFSAGASAALSVVQKRAATLFQNPSNAHFDAAIAFYPLCSSDNDFAVPTLILIGELDEWTPASKCRLMLTDRKQDDAAPVDFVVYPKAHHSFDVVDLSPGRNFFGHFIEYNAEAAEASIREVRQFVLKHARQ